MLQRSVLEELNQWFIRKKRKPLILRGARQVGKTTLVQMFCKRNEIDLIEINLEFDIELRKTFIQMDPQKILKDIEFYFKKKIQPHSLLFIDEIQLVPEAIQTLRYFFEKKSEQPIIAAGSLLEFVFEDHQFSMPVGRVEYLFIGPLTFSEFLLARSEKDLYQEYKQLNFKNNPSSLIHSKLLNLYYEYIHVGGMPEAVNEFVKDLDFNEAKRVQRTIVLNYKNDFSKYSKKISTVRLDTILDFIPNHISQKTKYSLIDSEVQAKSLKIGFDLLEKAHVIKRVYYSSCSGIPLKIGMEKKIFKTIFLDIGLASYILNFSYSDILKIYQGPPTDVALLHRGLVAEQFVGQHLQYIDCYEPHDLFYWIQDKNSQKAEVDYVIQKGTSIYPIEVKSGKTGSIRSLVEFANKNKAKTVIRLSTREMGKYKKNINATEVQLLEIPIYLTERIFEILEFTWM